MLDDQQVSCIFCSIVQKDEPASIVYEDAHILVSLISLLSIPDMPL
jgi:diadenosine tetraphosphate (Ap4A) HIT family hydrolase